MAKMDKQYFKDLLKEQKKTCDGNTALFMIVFGGTITAIGAIGMANGKNPIARTICSMTTLSGTVTTAVGGFHLAKESVLEDLLKTAPETVVEEPATEE